MVKVTKNFHKKFLSPIRTRPSSSSSSLLPPFLFSLALSSLGLPSLAATTGRAAAPFVTSSPSPLPAISIHQVCLHLLFPSAVRDGAPQTLTKLFVFGSESITIYYLLTSISFAKIVVCTCEHPCLILGPPLGVLNSLGILTPLAWSNACLSRWIIDYGTN